MSHRDEAFWVLLHPRNEGAEHGRPQVGEDVEPLRRLFTCLFEAHRRSDGAERPVINLFEDPCDYGPKVFWHIAEDFKSRRYDAQVRATKLGLSAVSFRRVDELLDRYHAAFEIIAML